MVWLAIWGAYDAYVNLPESAVSIHKFRDGGGKPDCQDSISVGQVGPRGEAVPVQAYHLAELGWMNTGSSSEGDVHILLSTVEQCLGPFGTYFSPRQVQRGSSSPGSGFGGDSNRRVGGGCWGAVVSGSEMAAREKDLESRGGVCVPVYEECLPRLRSRGCRGVARLNTKCLHH